jgi:hypothetical protein
MLGFVEPNSPTGVEKDKTVIVNRLSTGHDLYTATYDLGFEFAEKQKRIYSDN